MLIVHADLLGLRWADVVYLLVRLGANCLTLLADRDDGHVRVAGSSIPHLRCVEIPCGLDRRLLKLDLAGRRGRDRL